MHSTIVPVLALRSLFVIVALHSVAAADDRRADIVPVVAIDVQITNVMHLAVAPQLMLDRVSVGWQTTTVQQPQANLEGRMWKTAPARLDAEDLDDMRSKLSLLQTARLATAHMKVTASRTSIQIGMKF